MLDSFRGTAGALKAENGKPGLRVLTLFEDIETGKHARKTYDYLYRAVNEVSNFSESMWKFDVLSIPKLREVAAKDALEADLVIVSSHGGKELPEPVREWVDLWLGMGGKPLALVALFDCTEADVAGVRAYLAGVARRAGAEFFAQPCRPGSPGKKQSKHAEVFNAWQPPNRSIQPEDKIPRWGINE